MSVSLANNIYLVEKCSGAFVDCQKYSNLGKLSRVTTAYVLLFIKNIRLKMKNHELVLGALATADINFAQLQWIKFDQSFMIDSEHFTKIQSSLNLFYDNDSILRMKFRICGFENFTYNKKFSTRHEMSLRDSIRSPLRETSHRPLRNISKLFCDVFKTSQIHLKKDVF